MAYQTFSHQLRAAIAVSAAKSKKPVAIDPVEKQRRKEVAKARTERLLAENLEQRALIESRRAPNVG